MASLAMKLNVPIIDVRSGLCFRFSLPGRPVFPPIIPYIEKKEPESDYDYDYNIVTAPKKSKSKK